MADGAPIRFGILGCANIARMVSTAIALAPNAAIAAVASRSLDKASRFAAANSFPSSAKVYGSYESLLDDPDIDAVYVPLPTSLHLRWAVLAARKKKHILLEKPVALNVAEFDEIVEACDANRVQIMDGTMWMHNPRTIKMKEIISDPETFGKLNNVQSSFSFAANPDFLENDIRVKPDLDGLGALGDAGWYCIRSILWANDYKLPHTVKGAEGPVLNKAGVILSCGASLHFENGLVATFHCSFVSNLAMDLTCTGSKGTLHLNDFIMPLQEEPSFSLALKTGLDTDPVPSKHTVTTDLPQEACMVREFARLVKAIQSGAKPDNEWPIISRKTQLVLDAVKASIDRGCEAVEVVG